jgi:hypothetical protein
MEPLANIYNQLATKAYNKETGIHTHMHSLFSSQQLPHKTPLNAAYNSCLGESPSIPFIAIKRENHAAIVGCHLAPAHCLLQLVHSNKQAATILNLNCLPPSMLCRLSSATPMLCLLPQGSPAGLPAVHHASLNSQPTLQPLTMPCMHGRTPFCLLQQVLFARKYGLRPTLSYCHCNTQAFPCSCMQCCC